MDYDSELGYKMGVYLCIWQQIFNVSYEDALPISHFKSFQGIHEYLTTNDKVFIFMGEGQHKIKRKAEQIACNEALKFLEI